MKLTTKLLATALTGLVSMTGPGSALDIEFDGNLELELRSFPQPARHEDMESQFAAIAGQFELGFYSRSGRHAVIVKPFGRLDQHDHERSHADLREAKYRYVDGSLEVTVGADKEFWGVTEFLHLVDIINQTDNVESIDGEQKLGQPMVKLSYASSYGTVTAYALPFFRIRQYVDPITGRPNAGFIVDDNTTHFESGNGRQTDDYALRYHGLTARRVNRNYCWPKLKAGWITACPCCKPIMLISASSVWMRRPLWGHGC